MEWLHPYFLGWNGSYKSCLVGGTERFCFLFDWRDRMTEFLVHHPPFVGPACQVIFHLELLLVRFPSRRQSSPPGTAPVCCATTSLWIEPFAPVASHPPPFAPGPPHHRCTGSSPQSRWSSTPPSSRPSARIRRAAAASTCQPQPRRRGLRPWCIACRRLDPLPLASAIGSSASVRLRPGGHALHQLVVHARHVQQQDAVSEGRARPVFFFFSNELDLNLLAYSLVWDGSVPRVL